MKRSKVHPGDGVPGTDAVVDDEDVHPEAGGETAATREAASGDSDLDSVENQISELQRDLTKKQNKMQRPAAKLKKYKKRVKHKRHEAEARGKAQLVKDILEPMDD